MSDATQPEPSFGKAHHSAESSFLGNNVSASKVGETQEGGIVPLPRIVAFPDTNLFLHYRPLDEIDWCSLLQVSAVEIKIAPVVTRELEEQKNLNPSRKLKDRATTALKFLHKYLGQSQIRDRVTLEFLIKEPTPEFAASRGLNLRLGDDWLVGTLLLYREAQPGTPCALVTADLPLKVKATHYQIQVTSPGEKYELQPEPDPLEKKNKQLEAELFRYKSREPVLHVLFEGGENHSRFQLARPHDGDSEAEIQSMLDAAKQKFPLADIAPEQVFQASATANRAEANDLLGPMFETVRGLATWSRSLNEDYNQRAKEYYRQYERYLRDTSAFKTLPTRTIKLSLILANSGTCPADDIYVLLHFPDGFQLYDDDHLPKQPVEPPVPSKDMFPNFSLVLPSYLADFHASPQFHDPLHNPRLPRIRKTNSYDVTFENDKLLHGFVWNLTPLYVAFDSWGSIGSFSIDYNVHAGNMIDERTGKLGVEIETV